MYIRAKVVSKDGTDLPDEEEVSTANLWMNSLFNYLELSLNGKIVSAKPFYNYIAYIKARLGHTGYNNAKKLDTALHREETNLDEANATNPGYSKRKTYIANSKIVELCGDLYDDIFECQRYILPSVEARLKLVRSPNELNIWCTDENKDKGYKTIVETAILYTKKHILVQDIRELHLRQLEKTPAIYPYIKSELKTFLIPKSSQSSVSENIFSTSKLPFRIILGLVKTSSFNGSYSENPYSFQTFDMSSMKITVNSDASIYKNHNIALNDTNKLLAYQFFRESLKDGFDLSRETFTDGCNFFVFELTSSSAITEGGFKIEINFKKPLVDPLTAVVLAQLNSSFTIDKFANVELLN